jgi:hypothetical protein
MPFIVRNSADPFLQYAAIAANGDLGIPKVLPELCEADLVQSVATHCVLILCVHICLD